MNLSRFALLAALCFADGVLLLRAAPALAAEIITDVAPPPPRAENVGHPRDGYVWAAGHLGLEWASFSMGIGQLDRRAWQGALDRRSVGTQGRAVALRSRPLGTPDLRASEVATHSQLLEFGALFSTRYCRREPTLV